MTSYLQRLKGMPELAWLAMIVMAGLAIRAAALYLYPHDPIHDEIAYLSIARNLVGGHGLIDSHGNHAMYNVGYPLFILAPVFAVFGDKLAAIQVANVLLGGISIVLCHALAREAGAGKPGRLLAAAMWAVYMPAGLYTVYVAKENLMIPLMLGLMWCALRLASKAHAALAIGCGVLFGLLALTGNAALSLAAPVALALLYSSRNRMKCAGSLALIVCAAALLVTPWLVRNTIVLGAPVLNTNGGFNLYLGNNANANGMYMSIGDTPRAKTWDELRKGGEVQASQALKNEAVAWIAAHPARFAVLAVRKMGLFWTPPVHSGEVATSRIEGAVRLIWATQFFVLVGAAVAGLMAAGMRTRRNAILWLGIAAYTAVHMLFYVAFRYRLSIMPVVCVLAALSLEQLYGFIASRPGWLPGWKKQVQ